MIKLDNFSRRQILTLFIFGVADFFNAICVSLQAPFFPSEAEKKGSTAEEYGLVFGIFELVIFFISPVYGQYIKYIGPSNLFHGGILLSGICITMFGFLDLIENHVPFIASAFMIRIIEAMGNAAFLTASFSIIASEFPDNVGTAFAALETFFGLGLIVGPTLGGILYELGGYVTPFAFVGTMLFLTAVVTKFFLPINKEINADRSSTGRLLKVLKVEGIPVCVFTIMTTSMSIGFLSATLEPHVRQFRLSPVMIGVVFLVTGATYATSATCWGWLSDKYCHPKVVAIVGSVLIVCGITLVGPAPFFPLQTSLPLVIIGLVFHGLGIGARLVSSFTDALKIAIVSGFPNNLHTYGLVSGLWTSSFALGAFIGPTVSGILYYNYGFSNASVFLIVLVAIMGVVELLTFMKIRRIERKEYINSNSNLSNGIHNDVFYNSAEAAYSNGYVNCGKNGKNFQDYYNNNNGIIMSPAKCAKNENTPLLAESVVCC